MCSVEHETAFDSTRTRHFLTSFDLSNLKVLHLCASFVDYAVIVVVVYIIDRFQSSSSSTSTNFNNLAEINSSKSRATVEISYLWYQIKIRTVRRRMGKSKREGERVKKVAYLLSNPHLHRQPSQHLLSLNRGSSPPSTSSFTSFFYQLLEWLRLDFPSQVDDDHLWPATQKSKKWT